MRNECNCAACIRRRLIEERNWEEFINRSILFTKEEIQELKRLAEILNGDKKSEPQAKDN